MNYEELHNFKELVNPRGGWLIYRLRVVEMHSAMSMQAIMLLLVINQI